MQTPWFQKRNLYSNDNLQWVKHVSDEMIYGEALIAKANVTANTIKLVYVCTNMAETQISFST